jgi:hypothetical protein
MNMRKSKAMPLGRWDATTTVMGIQYSDEVKILGVVFHKNTVQTIERNWALRTRTIQIQAREMYSRDLGLQQRLQYVHIFLLARGWYLAQILPVPANAIRQINTIINYFIWKGHIFKVQISTMLRPKQEGGWGLVNVEAKGKALHYKRIKTNAHERDAHGGLARKLGSQKEKLKSTCQ